MRLGLIASNGLLGMYRKFTGQVVLEKAPPIAEPILLLQAGLSSRKINAFVLWRSRGRRTEHNPAQNECAVVAWSAQKLLQTSRGYDVWMAALGLSEPVEPEDDNLIQHISYGVEKGAPWRWKCWRLGSVIWSARCFSGVKPLNIFKKGPAESLFISVTHVWMRSFLASSLGAPFVPTQPMIRGRRFDRMLVSQRPSAYWNGFVTVFGYVTIAFVLRKLTYTGFGVSSCFIKSGIPVQWERLKSGPF